MSKKKKNPMVLAIIAIVLLGSVTFVLPMILDTNTYYPADLIPHGYDGIVSSVEVDHEYTNIETFYGDIYHDGVNPHHYIDGPFVYLNPTGVKCSITAPQYLGATDRTPIIATSVVYINSVAYTEIITLQNTIVRFEMFATVQTFAGEDMYYGDADATEHVFFWITLKNNDFSVFTDPEEVAVAILSVRTKPIIPPIVSQRAQELDFFPDAAGQDLVLKTSDGSDAPSLSIPTTANINVDAFNALREVMFPIHVIKADPYPETLLGPRIDCQVTFSFDIEVLLIGQWVEYRPYSTYEPPPPDKTWWELLLESIGGFSDWLNDPFNIIIIVVIVIVFFYIMIKIFDIYMRGRTQVVQSVIRK